VDKFLSGYYPVTSMGDPATLVPAPIMGADLLSMLSLPIAFPCC
jgi:hypothetical protein